MGFGSKKMLSRSKMARWCNRIGYRLTLLPLRLKCSFDLRTNPHYSLPFAMRLYRNATNHLDERKRSICFSNGFRKSRFFGCASERHSETGSKWETKKDGVVVPGRATATLKPVAGMHCK